MKLLPRYWIPLIALAMTACSSDPTPPAKSLPDDPVEPGKPPPPPPKCERLKDKCKATSSTWAKIAGTSWVFQPPEGWIYAQLEEGTMTHAAADGAVFILSKFEPPKGAAALNKARQERVDSLAEVIGLALSAQINWFGSPASITVGDLKLELREKVKAAKRANNVGALLAISASSEAGGSLFGIGFAAEDDKAGTGAILESLKTLKIAESGADKKDEKADEADDKAKD